MDQDLFTTTSYETARLVTNKYSTSFSKSSQLFDVSIRKHIYAIYGLVRIADEIVDTYKGSDMGEVLNDLEASTLRSLKTGFNPNPLVHAFVTTAQKYAIGDDLITPFFDSMRMDIEPVEYTQKVYDTYIYGSAEVIGLMCLKVFCYDEQSKEAQSKQYKKLEDGARALGAAYQKVNFLRDMKADHDERGRIYFPGVTFFDFDDAQKQAIIKDVKKDFKKARPAVAKLPLNARKAVMLSFTLYKELLAKLETSSAEEIKAHRIRVSTAKKLQLLVRNRFTNGGA